MSDEERRHLEGLDEATERERWEDFHARGQRPMNREYKLGSRSHVPNCKCRIDKDGNNMHPDPVCEEWTEIVDRRIDRIATDLRERLAGEIEAEATYDQANNAWVQYRDVRRDEGKSRRSMIAADYIAGYEAATGDAARIVRGATTDEGTTNEV